jgi:hypothetical protein
MRQVIGNDSHARVYAMSAHGEARVRVARLGAQSEPQFAGRWPVRLPLLPPIDEFRAVVAFAARAVCAGRATFPGLPRRSTKVRLPNSFVSHSQAIPGSEASTNRSCRERATFKASAGRHYSGARILV